VLIFGHMTGNFTCGWSCPDRAFWLPLSHALLKSGKVINLMNILIVLFHFFSWSPSFLIQNCSLIYWSDESRYLLLVFCIAWQPVVSLLIDSKWLFESQLLHSMASRESLTKKRFQHSVFCTDIPSKWDSSMWYSLIL
jgi:hypothetical protein